ncbi:hypothetical protein BGZ96_012692 [Linnemannia gamsii]|uniref:Uncharacterized protein n=1 Tax=Linnemannia gamsii TaxID=64522 RepID=A0ABQ7KAC2_9FUNG|nr:hypothetical protein BGZ96_012692 [Linnemannia gamsii]
MSATTPHGNDNSHSASIQIDPPTQPVPSTTTATPFPLPTHCPLYNGDDSEDSGDEDGPLLASTGGPSRRHHLRQLDNEPAPFLYRLHDWLADLGTRAKSCWLSARSMKAPLSGWRKALKWILIFLGIVLVLGFLGVAGWLLYEYTYVCTVDYSNPVHLEYSFNPEEYKNLHFHLDHHTVGSIEVVQVNMPYESDGDEVQIYVNARGSSSDIVRAVTLGTITNPEESSIEANVYLDMFDYEREEAFRRGCIDISVRIVMPANMTHFESLKVHHRGKGSVYIRLDHFNRIDGVTRNGLYYPPPAPTTPTILFDRLDIKGYDGHVGVVGIGATEELKMISTQGSLHGNVFASKRVEVESKQYTSLQLLSTSPDLDLKVSAETTVSVNLKSPYYGHVALKTWTHDMQPHLTSPEDLFVRQKKTRQTLTGYFPYPNGTEPEGHFPRIELNGVEANLHLYR